MRRALSAAEWRRAGKLAAAVLALHVVGFGTLLLFVIPRHFSLGHAGVFGLGLGVTAYTLGLRHAFDADHIAAIDNTTRKLMADGRRPLGVGFCFSLGHSTVVFAVTLLLAVGLRASGVEHGALQHLGGVLGAGISGVFLCLIAALNFVILLGILRIFRGMRTGAYDAAGLERALQQRGLLNRVLGRTAGRVTASWQMYPVGVLFGLGFDTASEVALLLLAGGAAGSGLPIYAILCLPVLFAAGMSLLDTIDGTFMNFAYGWALSEPVRKAYYNLTITGLSVLVAFGVGALELLSAAAGNLGLHGGFWGWVAGLDLNIAGYVIAGMFVVTWVVSLAVWHFGRIEQRWRAVNSA